LVKRERYLGNKKIRNKNCLKDKKEHGGLSEGFLICCGKSNKNKIKK